MDLVCTPSSCLGPPEAMVEHMDPCLDGMAEEEWPRAARAEPGSFSQCSTTVMRPLESMIFQEGT